MISSYRKTVAAILALLTLASCAKKRDTAAEPREVKPAEVAVVKPIPLGRMIAAADSLDDGALESLSERYPFEIQALLNLSKISDTVSDTSLRRYASSRVVTMFQPEINRVFPADENLGNELTAVAGRLAAILPDLTFPKIYCVVIPFNQSIIALNDTTFFVGMNHYLGADHPAYNGFADYLRQLKAPQRIPIDLAEAVTALSYRYKGENVISRLLYEGALVEAVMQATGVDEATALGYNNDQYAWAVANEKAAWEAIVNNKMLFSKDPDLANRLIAPAPATTVLNSESPGRLGRFIGHRIVASYLNRNSDTDMSFLLSDDFYNNTETLSRAEYQKR